MYPKYSTGSTPNLHLAGDKTTPAVVKKKENDGGNGRMPTTVSTRINCETIKMKVDETVGEKERKGEEFETKKETAEKTGFFILFS